MSVANVVGYLRGIQLEDIRMMHCFLKFTWMARLARTEPAWSEDNGNNSFLGLLWALDDLMDMKCLLQWFSTRNCFVPPAATAMSGEIFIVKTGTERTATGSAEAAQNVQHGSTQ